MRDPGISEVAVISTSVIIAFTFFVVCWLSWDGGYSTATKKIQREAIQAGAAEWVPGEDGEATFTWRGEQ